jgi:hypothetical protein
MFVTPGPPPRPVPGPSPAPLKLPAQMADPLARIVRTGAEPALGVDLKQPQPGWAVVLGLCLSPTDL